jgi:hypothetical protein
MAGNGWEIRPLGWLFLVVLGLLLIFSTIYRLRDTSKQDPDPSEFA